MSSLCDPVDLCCRPPSLTCTGSLFSPQQLSRAYPATSIFGLTKRNKFRQACIWLAHAKTFEAFILLVILMNCVTLAMTSPRDQFDDTTLGVGLAKVEYFFTAVFTLEMVLKIVAMGFIAERGTYLRNGAHSSTSVSVLGFIC